MEKTTQYRAVTSWRSSEGTKVPTYDRTHTVFIENKPQLMLTTANPLRGDATKLNPEDLLVAALSSCHMLTYLYLCNAAGIVITEYIDDVVGTLVEVSSDKSVFSEVTLNPKAVVASEEMINTAIALHEKAHELCIIANSVNFKVTCDPVCTFQ
ncbi:MAG: OsmC family protein [Flavipsychrobacter sp.]|nr:OsmC family protein [Flavipsychrobacter sp.]